MTDTGKATDFFDELIGKALEKSERTIDKKEVEREFKKQFKHFYKEGMEFIKKKDNIEKYSTAGDQVFQVIIELFFQPARKNASAVSLKIPKLYASELTQADFLKVIPSLLACMFAKLIVGFKAFVLLSNAYLNKLPEYHRKREQLDIGGHSMKAAIQEIFIITEHIRAMRMGPEGEKTVKMNKKKLKRWFMSSVQKGTPKFVIEMLGEMMKPLLDVCE